jgi:YjbE family integral membrane protein
VIGVAAAQVAKPERRRVIFWGLVAAVVLRILLAMVTATILKTIGLMFAGGILLLWVAWRLYREMHGPQNETLGASTVSELNFTTMHAGLRGRPASVRRAILQITVADLSMSLDNVLAVAGAALNHVWVLAVGLLLSIALMGLAATLIANLLQKMPWISYAGLIIVLYVALRMIWFGGMEIFYAT